MRETIKQMQHVYDCRQKYMIIGLTGRTGSGCTEAATLLANEFNGLNPPKPTALVTDDDRKYKIVYDFAKQNWKKFKVIRGRDVITSFMVLEPFERLEEFLTITLASNPGPMLLTSIEPIKDDFDLIHEQRIALKNMPETNSNEIFVKQAEAYEFYFEKLPKFSDKLKQALSLLADNVYTNIYQIVGDNIRSSGKPYDSNFIAGHGFAIALRINRIIKVLTAQARKDQKEVFVAIDAIRNPFEALFFRERYSAFYLLSINTPDSNRRARLIALNYNESSIKKIDSKEYPESLPAEKKYISQDIQKCIEISDIHVNNPGVDTKNLTTLKQQLIYYVTLIMHPGIVTPSQHERCMQIAYTAKLNSGCISRQVGAVITNHEFSIQAVGWNDTASGQVSCSLRNIESLINHEDEAVFSNYEFTNPKFREKLISLYKDKMCCLSPDDKKGLNISYCFKDVQNFLDEQKNQVHTRALHAEENAFLQITKYGGIGIKGGSLYSTASPCELCSKKAYQLGIQEIIYIDPYPGIANSHLLQYGKKDPKLKLFHGAIGRAFYQLYQPLFAYKDELSILLNLQIPNMVKALKEENIKLKKELAEFKEK